MPDIPSPLIGFPYKIMWPGGLTMQCAQVELPFLLNGAPIAPKASPHPPIPSDIVFKRCLFQKDQRFYEWWEAIQLDTVQSGSMTLLVMNELGKTVLSYTLSQAQPKKASGLDLASSDADAAIEEIQAVYDMIELQPG